MINIVSTDNVLVVLVSAVVVGFGLGFGWGLTSRVLGFGRGLFGHPDRHA